jgi:hypothetical protein
MQYPVSNAFANGFVNAFYRALLLQNDLLDALRTARRVSVRGAWYSPVLYLRHKRRAAAGEQIRPVYRTRDIDTAVPAEARAGVHFLVKLWIRRPETAPLSEERLRVELGVPEEVPIRVGEVETEVKFEPVEGRRLRRGAVEVRLVAPLCEVSPQSKTLFVDEHIDAPPAYFAVRSDRTGPVPLVFSVLQDGGEIASVVHHVTVVGRDVPVEEGLRTHSHAVRVSEEIFDTGHFARPGPLHPGRPQPEPSAPAGCLLVPLQVLWAIAGLLAFLSILGFG